MAKKSSGGGTGLVAFILGAAAGIAAGIYLNSEEGKVQRQKFAERAKEVEKDVRETMSTSYDEFKDVASKYAEKGRQQIEEWEAKGKTTVEDLTETPTKNGKEKA